MAAAFHPTSIGAPQQVLRGIRVVLACNDGLSHAEIRSAIRLHPEMCVVGEATGWDSLGRLMDLYVPEVVIVSGDLVQRTVEASCGVFPLIVSVSQPHPNGDRARTVAELHPGSGPEQIAAVVHATKVAVLEAKWQDVMRMLQACRPALALAPYISALEVSASEGTIQVSVEDVSCITAAKNYVRIESASGVFQTRSAMTDICARLDPERFVRIHRSVTVNKAFVASLDQRDGSPVAVVLRSGRRLPVGSTYREACSELLNTRFRSGTS